MLELSKMNEEERYQAVSEMTEEKLYQCIRDNHTELILLNTIASAITYFSDDFYDLLSLINLPQVNTLLNDTSLSSTFLECLEDVLLHSFVDDDLQDDVYCSTLEKVLDHPATTQQMLRKAYNAGFELYVMDKLDMCDLENRKLLKQSKDTNPNLDIRKQAYQRLKEDSNIKQDAIAVIIELKSLMKDFTEYINYFTDDNLELYDTITDKLVKKLSLLYNEILCLKKQMNIEKVIFIPVGHEIYEDYSQKLTKYQEGERTSQDYVSFGGNSKFCDWFYSCIAKVVNQGYIDSKGTVITDKNIVFNTGFYFEGSIEVKKSNDFRTFYIINKYFWPGFMGKNIVDYIDELTIDYTLLQVVDASMTSFNFKSKIIDCLETKEATINDIYHGEYHIGSSKDGVFHIASDDNYHYVKIYEAVTPQNCVAGNEYEGIIECFQLINETLKKEQELKNQGNIKALVRRR